MPWTRTPPPRCSVQPVFHLEIRQGTQIARRYNMTGPELDAAFLAPLMADRDFDFGDHSWTPRRVRIKIYDGPALKDHELALGLAWPNVERAGSDVTQDILARAREAAARQSGS